MFGKCANPDCKVPFDYRAGRLIPVRKLALNGQPPIGCHGVVHLWLCGNCSKTFTFEQECGPGQKIKLRVKELEERPDLSLVAVG